MRIWNDVDTLSKVARFLPYVLIVWELYTKVPTDAHGHRAGSGRVKHAPTLMKRRHLLPAPIQPTRQLLKLLDRRVSRGNYTENLPGRPKA